MSPVVVASASLVAVLLMMAAELAISRRHERRLRERGAVEPPGDVHSTMRWAYPGAFIAMAVEGAAFGPEPDTIAAAGLVLLGASKALKYWAIAALGPRWTFRVLVLPDVPLVTRGPYAAMRHPNYIAVVGELVSMALLVGARVTGPLATLLFSLLLRQRIRVENGALRHPPCS